MVIISQFCGLETKQLLLAASEERAIETMLVENRRTYEQKRDGAVLEPTIRVAEHEPTGRKRRLQRGLSEKAAQLAQQLYQVTRGSPQKALSLRNARRLVETSGVDAVAAALKKMVWLGEQGRITDAAGFMVVASRVSWRVQHGQTEPGMRALGLRRRRVGSENTATQSQKRSGSVYENWC
jgi:hypothetical protein